MSKPTTANDRPCDCGKRAQWQGVIPSARVWCCDECWRVCPNNPDAVQPCPTCARSSKIIGYYRKEQYGDVREFIHPDHKGDADILHKLTGRKTVDSRTRELVRDLTAGMVTFREVNPPRLYA